MKVINVQLSKEKLLALPEDERAFLIALGHLINEINTITKLLYWSAKTPNRNKAEEDGQYTMMLTFIRLLAGVLYESWELVRKKFIGTSLSKKYEPLLEAAAIQSFQSVKNYFKKSNNAAQIIRNQFAFHYSKSIKDVDEALNDIDVDLHAYLDRGIQNKLFHFSEVLSEHAMITLLDQNGIKTSIVELSEKFLDIGADMIDLSDAIMVSIINAYGKELRERDSYEVEFAEIPKFDNIIIPWFTSTKQYEK